MNLSQEALAEKLFVSRQSISNWETGKNYPDIHSLVLLGNLFEVSLDQLIKGDLQTMKTEIQGSEIKAFNHDSNIFSVLLLASIISVAPLVIFLKTLGMVLSALLFAVTFYYALRVEKHKKKNDIQTYKEILAFVEGKQLDQIEKHQEFGKRPYQKVLLALGSGLLTLVVAVLMFWLFG